MSPGAPELSAGAGVDRVRRSLTATPGRETLLLNSILCCFALAPVIAAFAFVAAYGVNIPYLDDWDTVRLIGQQTSGTLSLSDLFHQYNEHRIFFPRLVELELAKVDGFDTRVEMYVVLLSSLGTLVVLALAVRRSLGRSWLFLLPLLAYLTFSLRQRENFLWGFQIGFAFAEIFSALALYLLFLACSSRWRPIPFAAGAALSATVATYSVAQGLLVWPAGLVLILLSGKVLEQRRFLAAWTALASGEVALYFYGYHSAHTEGPSYVHHHPLAGCKYFLMLFGAALFSRPGLAFVCGSILFVITAAAMTLTVRRGETKQESFWLALLGFSLLAILAIAFGRTVAGAFRYPLLSRYTPFSLLAIASVLALAARLAFRGRSLGGVVLFASLTGLVIASVPGSYRNQFREARLDAALRKRAAYVLYTYHSQPDAFLLRLVPSAAVVRAFAPVLEQKHYSVFAGNGPPFQPSVPPPPSKLGASPVPSLCSIDSIGGLFPAPLKPVVVSPDRGLVIVVGWCVDAGQYERAGGVYVKFDGKYFPAYYGGGRPDVAAFYHNSRLVYSGFEAAVPVPSHRAGRHSLSVTALSAGGGTPPDLNPGRYYRPTPSIPVVIR